MKVLLVCPPTPDTFWSFKHAVRFVSKRAAFPPLGLLTVAGTLPAEWQLKLVDLNVKRLADDDLRWADYVMISAMIVHKESVPEIVNRCRRFSKPVIAGGPLFTTGHAAFPEIDHFVLGEAEELMPQVIEDMRCGTLRHSYAALEPARHHSRAVAPLGPDRLPPLRQHVGAVFAGVPVRLRVLRYCGHERPRSPHQIAGPVDLGTRRVAAARMAGHGLRRG